MKKQPAQRTCATCQWSYSANGSKLKCARFIVSIADAADAPEAKKTCRAWKKRGKK